MANRIRGAVPLDLGGRRYTLCLTLGALAELEDLLGAGDLTGLAARFTAGRLSARDLIALLGVALRGGGHDLDDAAVAQLPLAGGLEAVTTALEAVLAAAFGEAPGPANPPQGPLSRAGCEVHTSLAETRSPPPCGEEVGVGQEAPSRSILNHPHPWSLPAGSSDPGQARDRQGRGNALGSQAFGIQPRSVNAQARAGEGRGEGREPADLIDPSTRDACTPPSESAYPSPCPSPARERGPAPCSRRLAPPSAESAQGSEPDASVPTRLPNAFPWEDALAVGLGVLGWRPGDFWSATPREFAAALGPRARPEALTRAGFEDLLAAYPDRT